MQVQPCVDLLELWQRNASAEQPRAPGLSQLCALVLGKPLDKRMRLTNWARRPLTRQQTEYAALDALCLCDLYAELSSGRGWQGSGSCVRSMSDADNIAQSSSDTAHINGP